MRRTLLLCVLAVAAIALLALPACATVELYRVGVQNPGGEPIPQAPAFIEFTLNCTADVTVEILPSDSAGVPTGADAVRTDDLIGVEKGKKVHLWACIDDFGNPAPIGYYVAKITATADGTPIAPCDWDAIIGLFANYDKPSNVERDYHALDSAGVGIISLPYDSALRHNSVHGFYGIGINKDPDSVYYGRVYVPHQENKDIYIYDVDGAYLGKVNDGGVIWFDSAPWDCHVADDGYLYVTDRSAQQCHVFTPDGQTYLGVSPMTGYERASCVSVDPSTGITYLYVASGTMVYQLSLSADKSTWTDRGAWNSTVIPENVGGAAGGLYGMWVSPDQHTMYITSLNGDWAGVRKYTRGGTSGVFAQDGTFSASFPNSQECTDCTMGPDGYLWVARHRYSGSGTGDDNMYKLNASTGAIVAQYNTTVYPFMLATDAVGNVGVTFGKDTATWPGKFWGLFAEPGITTKVATVSCGQADPEDNGLPLLFYVPADPAPVLVPESDDWTYTDPSNQLFPDGVDSVTLTFDVIDPNGYSDIGTIDIDLKELRMASDDPIVHPTIVPDPGDPLKGNCTVVLTAVDGTQAGLRNILMTSHDADTSRTTPGAFTVPVAGCTATATVTHTRHLLSVAGATLQLIGGKTGVYGYPFTYTSAPGTDAGISSISVSAGDYSVQASKLGYKSQTATTTNIPAVTPTAPATKQLSGITLGPISIAEARALLPANVYCSIEGLTVAQPESHQPAAAPVPWVPGMDHRLYSSTSDTDFELRHTYYMCDATDVSSGLQFQLKFANSADFKRSWDDTGWKAPAPLNTSYYIGRRPADGETICVSGWLVYPPGYESRFILDDAGLGTSTVAGYKGFFYNLTQQGIVPPVIPANMPLPVSRTINQVYHGSGAPDIAKWGKFAQVTGLKVVKWKGPTDADTRNPDNNVLPPNGGRIKYVVVVDTAGNWGTVAFDSLSSYGLNSTVCPVTLGDTYTFKGMTGRRSRYSEGTLRPRGDADWTLETAAPTPDGLGVVRGMDSGSVTVQGIVTRIFGTAGATGAYMFVEAADRSVGVKVTSVPWYVAQGDNVVVTGSVMVLDNMKQIIPAANSPIVVLSSGNPLPELGMRCNAAGGTDFGAADPGITYGRGPLNIGLYVTIQGMVTYRNSTGPCYVWDGTNMTRSGEDTRPLMDEAIPDVRGLRINSNGWIAAAERALVPWQDFVTVKGIVGANVTAVPDVVIPEILVASSADITIVPSTGAGSFTTLSDAGYSSLLTGANLWATPAPPAYAGTGEVPDFGDPFSSTNLMPWNLRVVYGPNDPTSGDTIIFRWEKANISQYNYDMWNEDLFGGVTLGDGYWMFLGLDWPLSYSVRDLGIPQWYAVPGVDGEIWVGHPQSHATELSDITVSNGGEVKTFYDASQYGSYWVQSGGLGWDNTIQGQFDIGLPDDWPSGGTQMVPWHGYVFQMYEGNKAWIIP